MAILRRIFSCCRPGRECIFVTIILTWLVPIYLLRSSDILQIFGADSIEHGPLIKERFLDHINKHSNEPYRKGGNIRAKANVKHSHDLKHDASFNKLYVPDKDKYPDFLKRLRSSMVSQCGGQFKGFSRLTALLHDVVLDRDHCSGPAGGEDMEKVMNQQEEVEFLKYTRGFLEMKCDDPIAYTFRGTNIHLTHWMNTLIEGATDNVDEVIDDFTIAITRYEYVNMYHTMTDYYNAFLVMAFFNQTQHQTNILIVDAHPAGTLDSVWGTVFNTMTRVSQLPGRTRFTNLAFGILGYHSPLYVSEIDSPKLPLAEEFRQFFLSSYNLPTHYPLDCDKLSILLIWRRNYVAHPRNPNGQVHRKIMNEKELEEGIQAAYPSAKVRGIQADRFDVADQVKLFAECDILIGTHGAALTEMVFMHEGRAVIELFPQYVNPQWRGHFIKLAKEKNMHYTRWTNNDASLEHSDYRTEVPPQVVIDKISEVKQDMCSPT